MKIKVKLLLVVSIILILSACSSNTGEEKGAADNGVGNDGKYEKVSKYDKLLQNAERSLNRDDLEEAKDTYMEAREHEGGNELDVKIDNLEAFIPLAEDALFDYLINVGDKEYQVLLHAEDFEHTTASLDDGTAWACAAEGDEVYEGDYSIFTRERSQTTFTEHYLGESYINKDRDPVQTVEYDDGQLLVLAECQASSGSEMELYSIVDDGMEQVSFILEDETRDSIISSYNMIKDYNPSENKFQSISYNNMNGIYTISNFTFDVDANEMIYDESFELDDVEGSIDEWVDRQSDFYFEIVEKKEKLKKQQKQQFADDLAGYWTEDVQDGGPGTMVFKITSEELMWAVLNSGNAGYGEISSLDINIDKKQIIINTVDGDTMKVSEFGKGKMTVDDTTFRKVTKEEMQDIIGSYQTVDELFDAEKIKEIQEFNR